MEHPPLPWYQGKSLTELAEAVRSLRERSHLTQIELAELLDSSRSTMIRLEGAHDVSMDLTVRAFRALGYQLIAVPFGSTVQVEQHG